MTRSAFSNDLATLTLLGLGITGHGSTTIRSDILYCVFMDPGLIVSPPCCPRFALAGRIPFAGHRSPGNARFLCKVTAGDSQFALHLEQRPGSIGQRPDSRVSLALSISKRFHRIRPKFSYSSPTFLTTICESKVSQAVLNDSSGASDLGLYRSRPWQIPLGHHPGVYCGHCTFTSAEAP